MESGDATASIKTVLRIEHSYGWGMFRSATIEKRTIDHICPQASWRHSAMNTHGGDGLEMSDHHFCAYGSLEVMERWIKPDEVREVLKYDYKVYLIELSAWQEGDHNVIFRKEDIILKKDISDLFL